MSEEFAASKSPAHPFIQDDDLPFVDRVLAGDTLAFEELVRRHERRVYRTTLAVTGNPEDAEEAMQDTFFKMYRHLSEFQRESRFTTWLTRIAVNEGLQRLRRRRETESLDAPISSEESLMPRELEDWHEDPEKQYAREEIKRLVEEAIRSLPPSYRVVFVLRDLAEMSTPEAAEALGLTISALKSRLLRARLMVREALAKRFQRAPTLKSRMRRVRWMMQDVMMAGMRRMPGQKQEI